jgi:hypothetical protein
MPRRDQIRSGDQQVTFQARRDLVMQFDARARDQGCSRADLLRRLMIIEVTRKASRVAA